MRDDCELVTEIHLPPAAAASPAVLMRTPYSRTLFGVEIAPLVAAGYAVVVQSVRGRHGSEGSFVPYLAEGEDGYDTVEWVASQQWCDGQVAMIGASYGGWTQWAAARERPPSLKTLISSVCCASWTKEWPWADGVLWQGAISWLHMVAGSEDHDLTDMDPTQPYWPLRDFQRRYGRSLTQAQDWLEHPRPDDYWAPITLSAKDFAGMDLPVLHITGWFDGCQRGAQFLYEGMRTHSPAAHKQALLVGAWDHTVREMKRTYDGVDFGPHSVLGYHQERIAWLNAHLRDRGAPASAVRAFITGTNRWTTLPDLPHPDTSSRHWHLGGDGRLGEHPTDETRSYVYDPCDPTPTRSAADASYPLLIRNTIHEREDVLTWDGELLESAITLVGVARVQVHFSASVPDTDLFAELVDIAPDGTRVLVAHGRLRVRYRHADEAMLIPGELAHAAIEMVCRVHQFAPGHRLGLAIMSSGAPLWAPHPNQGGDLLDASEPTSATITIHSESTLTLPTLPATTLRP